MSFFGNISVVNAKKAVDDLISLQNGVIELVNVETRRLSSSKNRAVREIHSAVGGLVITGDNDRYSVLTGIAQQAGTSDNFSETVDTWTREDTQNRTERSALEEKWGARETVGDEARAIKEELDLTKSANQEVGDEIKAWDTTMAAIETHNEKYPTAPITEENHDEYEEFKLLRAVRRYTLGLIFNSHAGPYEAYKIVSPYNDKYGDFYEDKLSIYKLRQTHKEIQEKQAGEQARYNDLTAIASRMDELDRTYKGPEKIAALIRESVFDLVLENTAFGIALMDRLPGAYATTAVISAARVRGYEALAPKMKKLDREAAETKAEMEEPAQTLARGISMVAHKSISFDFGPVERKFDAARDDFTRVLDRMADARASIEYLQANSLLQAETQIAEITSLDASVPDRTFDLSELEREVKSEIRAEERRREEERRRREEAARKAREAAAARRRAESEARDRILEASRRSRTSGGSVFNAGSSRRSTSGGNIFGASNTRRR